MMTITHQTTLAAIGMMMLASCSPKLADQNSNRYGNSKVASITMPVPDKIKGLVGPGKIDAYSLSVTPGACDNGVTGSTINKVAAELTTAGMSLPSEKIKKGCAYTIVLSLGKANSAKSILEKIYLTNDIAGKHTELSADQTRADLIKATVTLQVTADAKKDLGVDDLGNSTGTPGTPDTTNLVSYQDDIKPIMANSCLSCHSAGGRSPRLDSLEAVKANYAQILSEINSGDMPKNGQKLPANQIDLIKEWGDNTGGQDTFQP